MIIRKPQAESGIKFAWWPVHTAQGLVWLEWVHWSYAGGWGWGSSDTLRYDRVKPIYEVDKDGSESVRFAKWVPQAEYDKGKRREFAKVQGGATVEVASLDSFAPRVSVYRGDNPPPGYKLRKVDGAWIKPE